MSILFNIAVNVAVSLISSVLVIVFSYYKFLRRIPETTEKRVNDLLDKRLCHETVNHNAQMQALNPDNAQLMRALNPDNAQLAKDLAAHDQRAISKLEKLVEYQNTETGRRERSLELMASNEKIITSSVNNLKMFQIIMENLVVKNQEIHEELQAERIVTRELNKEINRLNDELTILRAQSQSPGMELEDEDEWER
jgi:hypothetical protein